MSSTDPMETRLESLGSFLRERPALGERVMQEVRRSESDTAASDKAKLLAGRRARRRNWPWVAAVTALGVALALSLTFFRHAAIGWAEVTGAIRAQRWIRAQTTYADGQRAELWVSPQLKLWALKTDDRVQFADERERAHYEFDRRRNRVVKLPIGEQTVARMLPLEDLTGEDSAIGPWMFGTEKIIDQKRCEVYGDGKYWIEFELTFWRGNPNRGTLRVDPRSGLPVYLLMETGPQAPKARKWEFDYPESGPTSLADLDVPHDVAVENRMPPEEALRVLEGMSASRGRIGNFQMAVFQSDAGPLRVAHGPLVVWRKGEKWRVDRCALQPGASGNAQRLLGPGAGQTWDEWLAESLRSTVPQFVCDGKTVHRNSAPPDAREAIWQPANVAPQDLLSGDRSGTFSTTVDFMRKVYPDLTPPPGFAFEFDPRPAGEEGLVQIRISAELAGGRGTAHEWYYIDPARGFAVVRSEMFTLESDQKPAALPDERQTIRMEGFQESPAGFWYPTVVHETHLRQAIDAEGKQRLARSGDTTLEYRFDFDAELPDSLFDAFDDPELQKHGE